MVRDPCDFGREKVIQTVSQGQSKENTVSRKHLIFHSIIAPDCGVGTTFKFIVACGVQKVMSLGVAEGPQSVDDLPAGPDRRKRTNRGRTTDKIGA